MGARVAGAALTRPLGTQLPSADMAESFDFVVVGGGSAGAVVAARLSEDRSCRVALLEAGGPPPPQERMPAACPALQLNPETDWMYTADAGNCGLGLNEGRMMVPRGKMLGGSSAMNYMAYVRGHPGDCDSWAAGGATGWGYDDVLPYFKKSEGLAPSGDIVVDTDAHNTEGPLGVSVRAPVLTGAQEFVDAAVASGIPRGDYNGRDRGGADGVVSLLQTTTRDGKRSSTYHAFLEGEVEQRPNLEVICGAHVTRVILEDRDGELRATGVEYRTIDDEILVARADKEVILSAGAVGSPQILMLSGIGPKGELEAVGVPCTARRTRRRQAPQGPPPGRSPLPGAGRGHLDERDRRVDGPRRTADARRALASRSRRRCRLARGAPGAQGRSRAAGDGVGHHRPRPGVVVDVRRVRVVLHRPRRRPHARRPDSASSSVATTATSGAAVYGSTRTSTSTTPMRVSPPTPRM